MRDGDILRLGALLLALATWWTGCASIKPSRPTEPAVAPVWPAPPTEPRLAYVRSLYAPADLGIKPSGWARLGKWLTGLSRGAAKLDKPFGIALDEAGNLCLTDTGLESVIFLDLARKAALSWSKIEHLQFVAPVAVAKRKGIIYVADAGLGEVVAFNEQGKGLIEIKEALSRPSGLAISGDQLYVTDSSNHWVAVFDLAGKFRFKFGQRGAGPGEFNFPTHIAADNQGRLLVTDSLNTRIELFDATGRYLSQFGSVGDSAGHFSRPKGVAADSAGRLYVVDAVLDNLQIFDTAGRFLLDVGESGSNPGEFWLPNGIAISPDNHIFITDTYNHRVQEFKYVGPAAD